MDNDDRTREDRAQHERDQDDLTQTDPTLPERTLRERTEEEGEMEARVGDTAPGFIMQGEEDRVHKSPTPPIRTRVRPGCGGAGAAGTLGIVLLALLLSSVDILTP